MKEARFFIPFLLTLSTLLILASSCGSSKTCCEKHNKAADEALYCDAHKNAVIKYVKSTIDIAERRARYEKFKKFYNTVKLCYTLSCLESWIADDETMPGFTQRYALEHLYAEQTTQILRARDKRNIILCGFKDALKTLETTLETVTE